MARQSEKKRAAANSATLQTLLIGSGVINTLYILQYYLFGRPSSIKPFLILSIPALIIQYQFHRIAKPTYDDRGALISAGEDLSQGGINEWLLDIIYMTWICDVLTIIIGRNWVWFLYLAIPGYALFKIYNTFLKGRISRDNTVPEVPESIEPVKSKRQAKLEKRSEKTGGQRTKTMRA
ncbi:DUF788-domain-containing protein [Nadsonia fulvescens var. elongata DSM 6958]|uniref:DUF788-domain-containing protein n=1 Tax=Nadsonia fulvescens var. elongata DSM 6958 TaxID=857566 RepID=A0A1E3PSF8_9ASCO|nr:DUF788-domain-containing protein [Nadsonia fulvescens var. elongata DSM 6958]